MKYDLVSIGGAVEDITFYPDDAIVVDNKHDILRQRLLAFEYGAKIKVKEAHSTFGGGAANAAVSAKNLGLKSACVCAVGDDYRGKSIIRNLKEQKVDTRYIKKIRGEMSGFSFLLVGPENEHVIFSHRAANAKLEISNNILKKIDSEWIYITSLSGDWHPIVNNIFKHHNRFKVAWNPGYIQLTEGISFMKKFLKHTDVINLNEDEAIEFVATCRKAMRGRGKSHKFLSNIKNLLTVIHSYGPEVVMITRGRKGADAYDGKKFYHTNIKKEAKRVDTTGVGDAFGSAFVSGLKLYDGNIEKAMNLGIRNSASVIAEKGAQNGLLKL